jgi:hypothetical protein
MSAGNTPLSPPAPRWEELPEHARDELGPRGYDAGWFASHHDEDRLTVLTLYVKLSGLGLWSLVGREVDSSVGALQFACSDVQALKRALREHKDFTRPEDSALEWSCRERRAIGSLHFKHFKGWPDDKVQAHIDPQGLLLSSDLFWLLPVLPLGQMLLHALNYWEYKNVGRVRALLIEQGAPRELLCGSAARPDRPAELVG